MLLENNILHEIKNTVKAIDPTATVIVYGSFARAENTAGSDIDLLILIDRDYLTAKEKQNLKYPLYDIEFKSGQIISPLVFTRSEWESRHRITPFYENIKREGVKL